MNFPLEIGEAAHFVKVREALSAASFNEAAICRTLGIARMSDVESVDLTRIDTSSVPAALPLLLRLFVGQGLVPRTEVERAIDRPTLEAFLKLGILGAGDFGEDVYARVLLYPVSGFWIASDRHSHPDGSPFTAAPDIVFPAIFGGTLRFLSALPSSRAEAALDLCAGTGIGAFVMSRTSTRAVSSDVTERATHFARFNRALNGLGNVDVVRGDLYEAVKGETFDRIIAHPPYVPSLAVGAIWRDGGMTGEMLARRIVEGLPAHLRPGGLACIVSLGPDTAAARYEDRVRGWLGDAQHEFDVLFAPSSERAQDEMLRSLAERDPKQGPEGLAKLKAVFEAAEVVTFAHGPLVIRRRQASARRQGWTVRVKASDATDGLDLERAFILHDRLLDPRFPEALSDARVAVAPRLKVKVTHVVKDHALVPADYVFETDKPFVARGEVDGWMVPLIARLNGMSTPREVYAKAKADGELPAGFDLRAFCRLLARMIERGFIDRLTN